ncbi:Stage II sporulation protein M [Geobacillus sp. BCO2]|nr:Stage II sporulation protein M [Geobacillus sp. BCO2]
MRTHPLKSAVAVHWREHASLYVFVIVLFLMGVIFGAIVVNSLVSVKSKTCTIT